MKTLKTTKSAEKAASTRKARKAILAEKAESGATTETAQAAAEVAKEEEAEEANTSTVIAKEGSVLSTSEIKKAIPAAFAKPSDKEKESMKAFIPTPSLLKFFEKLGWKPVMAKQNGIGKYARHVVYLNNENVKLTGTKGIRPEIILDNNYQGRAQVHMGLQKEGNISMVVGAPAVKFSRDGVDFENFQKITNLVSDQFKEIKKHIEAMKQVILPNGKAKEFIVKAMAYREPAYFIDAKTGTILTDKVLKTIDPNAILAPLKSKTTEISLWDVFNLVQETLVKGEFDRKSLGTGRVSRPRSLTGAARNIRFNKNLWSIAEEYLPKTGKKVAPAA